jgi:hypothetical protein
MFGRPLNLKQDNSYPAWHSNLAPPEYEYRVLPLWKLAQSLAMQTSTKFHSSYSSSSSRSELQGDKHYKRTHYEKVNNVLDTHGETMNIWML